MFDIKSFTIDFYRFATLPLRNNFRRKAKASGKVPVGILFYHRVSDEFINDWTMSEDDFQRQIDWLEENFDLISLAEAQQRIRSGFNDRPSVSITFDDGYADNCNWALPMLMQRNIPITYFVTVAHPTTGTPFPHDVKAGQHLRPNTIESIKSLASAGVEIGAHTRNHVDLGQVDDPEVLFDEVVVATRELEEIIDRRVRYFAFPYGQPGNLNGKVVELAKQHGFEGICSTCKGWNHIGDDAFHLQRFHGDPNLARVKNWLTYDPRSVRTPKFEIEQRAEPEKSIQQGLPLVDIDSSYNSAELNR